MRTKQLTIAVIMQSPDIGGAEMYMLSLLEQFHEKGHIVLVATNKGKFYNLVRSYSYPIYKIPIVIDIMGNYKGLVKSFFLLPVVTLYYLQLLYYLKKKQHVDVILMSAFSEKMLVSLLSVFYNIPVIWFEYGPLTTVFARNLRIPELVYSIAKLIPKKIITPSTNTYKNIVEEVRFKKGQVSIIPCGTFVSVKKMKKNRNIDSIDLSNKFVIGNISRIAREKGQEYLIKAMPSIRRKIENAFLIISGQGPDQKYLRELVVTLKLEDSVQFLDFFPKKDNFYNSLDVFVFPTVWELEGFGLVIVEAMAHSVPVIASDIGPVSEIIENGVNGLLFEPRNSNSIATTVINYWSFTESKKRLIIDNAYRSVKEKYNIQNVSDALIKEIHHVTN